MVGEHPRDDRGGSIDAALREADQSQPRALLTAEGVGGRERFLGALEVAESATDLADLDVARRHVGHVEAVELGARLPSFSLGGVPVAAELEQCSMVDPADAWPHRHRVLLRPAERGIGPLRGAAEVAELLAGADQAAVHLAGGERAQLALDGRQHGLVEVAESLGRVTRVDEEPADRLEGRGLEVDRPQPASQCQGVAGQHRRSFELAGSVRDLGLP